MEDHYSLKDPQAPRIERPAVYEEEPEDPAPLVLAALDEQRFAERAARAQAALEQEAAARPPVRRRRKHSSWTLGAAIGSVLEAAFVAISDPRWWGWMSSSNRARKKRRPPLPLPTAVAPGQPVLPPPIVQPEDETDFLPKIFWNHLRLWLGDKGRYHVISTIVHAMAIILLGLIAGHFQAPARGYGPTIDATLDTVVPGQNLVRFKLGDAPLEPSVLDTEALEQLEPVAVLEQINDDSAVFEERGGGEVTDKQENFGGMGGFSVKAVGAGPALADKGGVGIGVGTGEQPGSGGSGGGFGARGSGMREAMAGGFGGTRHTERAVSAALNWIARHQNPDGSWSLDQYQHRCKDKTCTGEGELKSDSGATALALLPFLAAGQTQDSDGPYRKTIRAGLHWLVNAQLSDGSLIRGGSDAGMYAHGLATIAICEDFALTRDSRIGAAAQKAIDFIEKAQNESGGGWRYEPGMPGDTSVTGWQVMALKSAQMAGLKVSPDTLKTAKKYLLSVATGSAGEEFSYLKGDDPSPTMTAVGLLCSQYLGAKREDAILRKGMAYLNRNSPIEKERDCYYWYYATQVMHNLPGPQWDAWNRQLRKILVKSQIKDGCAVGSWDPDNPTSDLWGKRGGRLMQTSLSALSLEVYYRYLPLYRIDGSAAPHAEGEKSASTSPEVHTALK